jgi:hypothetical protein
MGTGLKVVLWIVGIIGALLVVLVVGGYFLGKSMVGDIEEANKFAASHTKQECVDEMSTRLRTCDGMKCYISAAGFGAACLPASQGEARDYCADVPGNNDKEATKKWSGEFCDRQQLQEAPCAMAMGMIVQYCGAR